MGKGRFGKGTLIPTPDVEEDDIEKKTRLLDCVNLISSYHFNLIEYE